ncbi:MAG: geranylgeranylglycerol-phosphate geranylgeranyltransferase [Bacteroidales bacterium]|nr:geranylgeranylglycerol-phosphate geranylgeranyltransferase [Bacteroidales bacterium]
MTAFLKLIRWQNLLIVAITQFLIRYALVDTLTGTQLLDGMMPGGTQSYLTLQLPFIDFLVLVFATVCIAAGGYAINDYFDIRTDLVNRGEVIVGTKIPRRRAMMWHNILSALGVLAGFWVSYRIGYLWIGIIFLMVSGLLYFYSVTYKKQFLLGNIIVALLTAFVPLMVVLYELPAIYNYYGAYLVSFSTVKIIFYWVAGFSVFAFLTTLAREIVKDMEDFEGDRAYGSRSLPVVSGLRVSKIVVSFIVAFTIILMMLMWALYINDIISLLYILLAIALPLVFGILLLIRGKSQEQFRLVSTIIKGVMLTGILYTVLFRLISEKGLSL